METNILYQGEFVVPSNLESTMQLLCYAEYFPLSCEPGWEDDKALIGDVRDGGDFDVTMFDEEDNYVTVGTFNNRVVNGNTLTYEFQNMPNGDPLFTIVSVFELFD